MAGLNWKPPAVLSHVANFPKIPQNPGMGCCCRASECRWWVIVGQKNGWKERSRRWISDELVMMMMMMMMMMLMMMMMMVVMVMVMVMMMMMMMMIFCSVLFCSVLSWLTPWFSFCSLTWMILRMLHYIDRSGSSCFPRNTSVKRLFEQTLIPKLNWDMHYIWWLLPSDAIESSFAGACQATDSMALPVWKRQESSCRSFWVSQSWKASRFFQEIPVSHEGIGM